MKLKMDINLFKHITILYIIMFCANIHAQTVSTFAGSGNIGTTNGIGTAAEFNFPMGLSLDDNGNLYVTDRYNNIIRKITPTSVVSTIAGSGLVGSLEGAGTSASFHEPMYSTVDNLGNVYVADVQNYKIRKITPAGIVSTFAGSGTPGVSNGIGTAASFYSIKGIEADQFGNVFVIDGNTIRKITPASVVSTLAGSGVYNTLDGVGLSAEFSSPIDMVIDVIGNIFVTETNTNNIRKITTGGDVTTMTFTGVGGAVLSSPQFISMDGFGNLFVTVTSAGFSHILKITPSGVGTMFFGPVGDNSISGIASNSTGEIIYYSHFWTNTICRILSCNSTIPQSPISTITQPSTTTPTGVITITSPLGAYEYSIDNINYQSSTIFTNVAPGNYNVSVRNSGSIGCVSTPTTITVNAVTSPPIQSNNSQILAAGSLHSLAICSDGNIEAWGDNSFGCLGTGDEIIRYEPVSINSISGVVSVAAGEYFSLALKNDGTLWSWGRNVYGELGNGSLDDRSHIPVQVSGLTNVVAMYGGNKYAIALKNDGTVWAWGKGAYGVLGTGNNIDSRIPVQVINLNNVIAIAAGYIHCLALKSDGTVWTWGDNYYGQLGNGTTTSSNFPINVPFLTGVSAVSAGNAHSTALKSDGTVWNWGWNTFGQLGNGSAIYQSEIPVQVNLLSNIIALADGTSYWTLALKNDGTVWSWGRNDFGQLGNGTTTDSNIPVNVSLLTDVINIKAGGVQNLALKSDGSLRVWGYGGQGALGLGSGFNGVYSSPLLVNNLCSIVAEISEFTNPNSTEVFPNPTSGIISIDVDNQIQSEVVIYNNTWQKVITKTISSESSFIDLSELQNGIYYVYIQNENGTTSKKIVLNK